jgi:hypothetical protein
VELFFGPKSTSNDAIRAYSIDPELCQLDQLILERLLQFPVTQISRINLHSHHPNACIYTGHLAAQIPNDLNLKNLKVL